ncbi:hypothetical protein Acy02nite_22090 [Actinoplanes cyaneus]|uniref:Uncharacterized protein n=2 Tax=Actinoplanes cyaneus TaxID=52696 RepID=A0A919M4L6_9ACTN|nr:hypothetical protein Acy02nite_22090 [Actinoplanes cyaneus]
MVAASNWVSDNTSFLVGTVLGIAGIVTGAYFYIRSKQTKTLDWRVVSNNAIAAAQAARSVNMQMIWKGKHLSHPRLIVVKIANTGTEAISWQDLYEPIQISVEGGNILDATIVDRPTEANFLTDEAKLTDDSIAFSPRLLNSGEAFTVQLLLDAEKVSVEVRSRIAGLSRPVGDLEGMRNARQKKAQRWAVRFGIVLSVTLVTLGISARLFGFADKITPLIGLLALMLGVCAGVLTSATASKASRGRGVELI